MRIITTLDMKRIPVEFRVAAYVAITLGAFASFLWINGDSNMGDGYYFGDKVYALGAPLTSLINVFVRHYGELRPGDDVWAVPAMDVLLTLQLFLWALLVFIARRLIAKRSIRRMSNQLPDPTLASGTPPAERESRLR